jgi:ABC-2 type transport system ATP-binding protein
LSSIYVKELVKRFGEIAAVDNVSFEVEDGEFFGFLGPNGAGKTTTIRMLTTLIIPTSGTALVEGFDVVKESDEVRRSIGVVPQAMTSDLDLTGYENMDIYGRFYGMPAGERRGRIARLLDIVGLTNRGGDLVATYSGGMRRRLEIVKALVHRPKILFLDEPTQGLDPQSRRAVWNLLREFEKEEKLTICMSTHYMEEADALCRRVAIMDNGKIIALDTPERLKEQIPEKDIVLLEVMGIDEALIEALKKLDFVHEAKEEDGTLRVEVKNGHHVAPLLLAKLVEMGKTVTSMSIKERSLEEVFIHYTGRTIREEEAKKISIFVGAGVPRRL